MLIVLRGLSHDIESEKGVMYQDYHFFRGMGENDILQIDIYFRHRFTDTIFLARNAIRCSLSSEKPIITLANASTLCSGNHSCSKLLLRQSGHHTHELPRIYHHVEYSIESTYKTETTNDTEQPKMKKNLLFVENNGQPRSDP